MNFGTLIARQLSQLVSKIRHNLISPPGGSHRVDWQSTEEHLRDARWPTGHRRQVIRPLDFAE
jgi:hypothetical protein